MLVILEGENSAYKGCINWLADCAVGLRVSCVQPAKVRLCSGQAIFRVSPKDDIYCASESSHCEVVSEAYDVRKKAEERKQRSACFQIYLYFLASEFRWPHITRHIRLLGRT